MLAGLGALDGTKPGNICMQPGTMGGPFNKSAGERATAWSLTRAQNLPLLHVSPPLSSYLLIKMGVADRLVVAFPVRLPRTAYGGGRSFTRATCPR